MTPKGTAGTGNCHGSVDAAQNTLVGIDKCHPNASAHPAPVNQVTGEHC